MLSKAEARHEIERLIYGYAEALDDGDLARIRELFAHAEVIPQPGWVVRGGDAVAEMFATHTIFYDANGPADPWAPGAKPHTRHVVTNLVIDVADDFRSASAKSYVIVFQARPDLPLQPVFRSRYRDRFVCEAGVWRFAVREMVHDEFGAGDTSRHLRERPRRG
ncbi:MAG TPA: nuclear transport factor 2 family protein [Myxococcota bacterium]|nr:nuclear transport factor 2 family protein [Myxococcota bacterium]